jgi:hypothetical protein
LFLKSISRLGVKQVQIVQTKGKLDFTAGFVSIGHRDTRHQQNLAVSDADMRFIPEIFDHGNGTWNAVG